MLAAVRVGIADSGINPRDPQVGGLAGGVGIRFHDGRLERDGSFEDRLGHGTAVAATIRGHAPGSALYSIRIFGRALEARAEALVGAIEWAAEEGLDLLNLSLGCTETALESELAAACEKASRAGLAIVSAAEADERPSLPGAFAGVVSVRADPDLEDEQIAREGGGGPFRASPWARRRGVLPRERNFQGTSFAVAHVTGIAARLLEEGGLPRGGDIEAALSRYASRR